MPSIFLLTTEIEGVSVLNKIFGNITDLSKFFIKQVVCPEDNVIDATAGNGHDTIFLAKLLSNKGKVFSFDIQKQAIEKTKEKLESQNLSHKVSLLHTGHQEITKHVKEKISAAMFNLGYLPGGNHSITTRGSTTISAIKQSMCLLKPGGIVSICVYHGHPEGKEELEEILAYTKSIDYKNFNVLKIEPHNKKNCPPILIIIEKKS